MEFEIVPGETHEGAASRTLTGFVYADDVPYAVYFARYSPAAPERGAVWAVSIGGWDDGELEGRRCVGVQMDATGAELIDAEETPWHEGKNLGEALRAGEVPEDLADEVMEMLDTIVAEDDDARELAETVGVERSR